MNNELNTGAQKEQAVPLRPLRQPRLTIRISQGSLSFAVPDVAADHQIIFLPYTVRSGVSMAANLREAFRTEELLSKNWSRALVMLDTPYVLLPLDDYDEGDSQRNAIFYHHAITGRQNDVVLTTVLPTLNAAVLFTINRDLKLVIDDHFPDVKFMPLSQPVWNHLHRRSSRVLVVSCLAFSTTSVWRFSLISRTVSASVTVSRVRRRMMLLSSYSPCGNS